MFHHNWVSVKMSIFSRNFLSVGVKCVELSHRHKRQIQQVIFHVNDKLEREVRRCISAAAWIPPAVTLIAAYDTGKADLIEVFLCTFNCLFVCSCMHWQVEQILWQTWALCPLILFKLENKSNWRRNSKTSLPGVRYSVQNYWTGTWRWSRS
jgi:hypothetical protein